MSNLIRDAFGATVPQIANSDGTYRVVSNGDAAGVDFSNTVLIRAKFGLVVPQLWDATNERWTVLTNDGSIVTNVDFSKTYLLTDGFGKPIPQLWDVVNKKWIAQTESISSGGSGGGNTGGENPYAPVQWDKPYPRHDELTDGKEFIIVSRLDNQYILSVFNDFSTSNRIYTGTTTTSGYVNQLNSTSGTSIARYVTSDGEWVLNDSYPSAKYATAYLKIEESSLNIYNSSSASAPILFHAYRELKKSKTYIVEKEV